MDPMPMTPLQFRRKRLNLGFTSQAKAAHVLGVTPQAVSRWECGAPVPLWAIKFLECLAIKATLTGARK